MLFFCDRITSSSEILSDSIVALASRVREACAAVVYARTYPSLG